MWWTAGADLRKLGTVPVVSSAHLKCDETVAVALRMVGLEVWCYIRYGVVFWCYDRLFHECLVKK